MKKIMLTRLQPKFVQLVHTIMDRENLTQKQLATMMDIPEPNLSNLLTIDPETGTYKRKLSSTYLTPFFKKRKIHVNDIYDKKAETAREVKYWKESVVIDDQELVDIIVELGDNGLDVKAMLKSYLAGIKK